MIPNHQFGSKKGKNKLETKGEGQLPTPAIYFFGEGKADGHSKLKHLLGGKGANLAEMTELGIPVPPGFTISTEVCHHFYANQQALPAGLLPEVKNNLLRLEGVLGRQFGSHHNPLLVSVRSGAQASMPGMMDTILNLGLNDTTVDGLGKGGLSEMRFALDCYRRLIQMYSEVVMAMNASLLDVLLEDKKASKGLQHDSQLSTEDLSELIKQFKNTIMRCTGRSFPQDPLEQLEGAITAVFKSWNSSRAKTYRSLNSIPDSWGTAVTVQAMVFGNMSDDSATGVAFTRDPSNGNKVFFGEFLLNAQGEDVVAGIRTPQPLSRKPDALKSEKNLSLEEVMPQAYLQLVDIKNKLERHFRDMQDLEFTIERGRLWLLQTRTGKRTTYAAIKIACDLLDEKWITEKEALMRVHPNSLEQLLHPRLDPEAKRVLLGKGLPASPGGASGYVVFTSAEAVEQARSGKKVILVRHETSPEDIAGMASASGILTTRGGMTSHAAVVARGMGRCCVVGFHDGVVDYDHQKLVVGTHILGPGELITLDGATGELFLGQLPTVEPILDEVFDRFMALSDKYRRLGVRANADTPADAKTAIRFGAEGIGLCRTEHMFFGVHRIDLVREMILAGSFEERALALAKLEPLQRDDFYQILSEMHGRPVTIRLLDPPLHEFVPQSEKEIIEFCQRTGQAIEKVRQVLHSLHEMNPMLGHRGCRLAITFPEIYRMQARALAEAACLYDIKKPALDIEIMVPFISLAAELKELRELIKDEMEQAQKAHGRKFVYHIGTMIELPRAALTADEIAEHADFFSFGTNDLTQSCMGLSRDDAARFLGLYLNRQLVSEDPFMSLDCKGVGQLIKIGVDRGRESQPELKIGVCGEHGGDPKSIDFFHAIGLDYVSCSPYRVPVARLAAAQAALKLEEETR